VPEQYGLRESMAEADRADHGRRRAERPVKLVPRARGLAGTPRILAECLLRRVEPGALPVWVALKARSVTSRVDSRAMRGALVVRVGARREKLSKIAVGSLGTDCELDHRRLARFLQLLAIAV
jgi:hypothetical protein